MEYEKLFKSSQEQASAAWISYLNELRLKELLEKLAAQDINTDAAMKILEQAKETIAEEIVNRNRGGVKGMHGFIAEVLQVAFENAEKSVDGQTPNTIWLNNNGPADIQSGDKLIQQKFVQKYFSLDAIKAHLEKYPDFLENGDKYQIPKDYYEKLMKLWNMSPEEAARLTNTNEDGLTYAMWKKVHEFFDGKSISIDDLEPSNINYSEAQKGKYDQTITGEKGKIQERDKHNRNEAYQASKPTLKEGTRVAAVSAALEGGMAFSMGVRKKLKEGKKIYDFTAEDWKELGIDTVEGTVKGSIRGASVYVMTNFTATDGAVASSLVTAVFGIVAQASRLNKKEISGEDFLINSQAICLESAVSAIASVLGEVAIPIPVLGAVVGNTVGMFMYGLAKEYMSNKEQELVAGFKTSMEQLNQILDIRYQKLIQRLRDELEKFTSLLEWAFDPDVNKAFAGSVQLAKFAGVSESKILKTMDDIDHFFTV